MRLRPLALCTLALMALSAPAMAQMGPPSPNPVANVIEDANQAATNTMKSAAATASASGSNAHAFDHTIHVPSQVPMSKQIGQNLNNDEGEAMTHPTTGQNHVENFRQALARRRAAYMAKNYNHNPDDGDMQKIPPNRFMHHAFQHAPAATNGQNTFNQ